MPTFTRLSSDSVTSAWAQRWLRSVISRGASPGETREPSTTVLAVMMPLMGERRVRVFCTSPVFSSWSRASAGMSHSCRRRRAESSRSPPDCFRAPPLRAFWVRWASRNSRWALTNSGL